MRQSPISVKNSPEKTRIHHGFEVALCFDNENDLPRKAPAIVDLSHMTKWDVQDQHPERLKPLGTPVPEKPGACLLTKDSSYIFRLNQTQAGIWHIQRNESASDFATMPLDAAYTDVTDGYALLGIVGPGVPSFIEKITRLDLAADRGLLPQVVQGPVLEITCRIIIQKLTQAKSTVLLSFARNFGQTMLSALLDSGTREGVDFAGEDTFFSHF